MSASARRDRALLYATAVLRALTTSAIGVTLGVYLARSGFGIDTIGAIVSAGLSGAVLAAVAARCSLIGSVADVSYYC